MPYALLSCSFVTLFYLLLFFLNEINGEGDGGYQAGLANSALLHVIEYFAKARYALAVLTGRHNGPSAASRRTVTTVEFF